MKICIHIGLHKTGSSSLQHSLEHSKIALAKEGIIYPAMPSASSISGQHHDVADLAETESWDRFENQISDFYEQAENNSLDSILLSSESFSVLPPAKLARMDRILEGKFSEVKYFCVFRNLKHMIQSKLNQRIEHNAVSLRDAKQIKHLCQSTCQVAATVLEVLSNKLTIVSYSKSANSKSGFCNALLADGLGVVLPIGIMEVYSNSSRSLYQDPFSYMTGALREAISIELGLNPYAHAVSNRLNSVLDKAKLVEAFGAEANLIEMGKTLENAIIESVNQAYTNNIGELRQRFPSLMDTELFSG